MRVPLFRWQHRLHRWTSDALLLRSHGPARRDSEDAPTHRGARPPSGGCLDARPHAPLAGVPPLAQAARNRVSVLVEFAGDPPVLVTQFALCNIRQLLLAHVSAVR
jgi:hypothetical protein